MFASLSGASEKENLQYNHKVNTIANVTVKTFAQYFGLKKLIQEVKSNKGNLKGKRPYINSSFKYNCIKNGKDKTKFVCPFIFTTGVPHGAKA